MEDAVPRVATMSLMDDADKIIERLQTIKAKHGEAAYKEACRDIAHQALHLPQGDTILRKFFPEFDPDELRAETSEVRAPDTPTMPSFGQTNEIALGMIREQIPNLKTQGQFNVFMACFNALQATLNSYFGGDLVSAELTRNALNETLDLGKKLGEMAEKLREVPDEVKSKAAKEFSQPAKELHEQGETRALMVELERIDSIEALQIWYDANRARLDRIVSTELRNKVFDTIRQKRNALGAN